MKWSRSEVIRGGIILLLFIYVVFGGLFDKFDPEKGKIENILKKEAYSIEFYDVSASNHIFMKRGINTWNGIVYPYTVVYTSKDVIYAEEIIATLEGKGYALTKQYYILGKGQIYEMKKIQGLYQEYLTCEICLKDNKEFLITYQYEK